MGNFSLGISAELGLAVWKQVNAVYLWSRWQLNNQSFKPTPSCTRGSSSPCFSLPLSPCHTHWIADLNPGVYQGSGEWTRRGAEARWCCLITAGCQAWPVIHLPDLWFTLFWCKDPELIEAMYSNDSTFCKVLCVCKVKTPIGYYTLTLLHDV